MIVGRSLSLRLGLSHNVAASGVVGLLLQLLLAASPGDHVVSIIHDCAQKSRGKRNQSMYNVFQIAMVGDGQYCCRTKLLRDYP